MGTCRGNGTATIQPCFNLVRCNSVGFCWPECETTTEADAAIQTWDNLFFTIHILGKNPPIMGVMYGLALATIKH